MYVYTKDNRTYLGTHLTTTVHECGKVYVAFADVLGAVSFRKASKVNVFPTLLPEPLEDI